jgi:signal transduction histidine kinase
MRRPAIRTFTSRTVVLLAVAVALAFLVLGVVYYRLVSNSFMEQQSVDLRDTAYDVSETYVHFLSETKIATAAPYFTQYLRSTARSTGSIIWVIDITGVVRYATDMPGAVAKKLELRDDGLYRVPDSYRFALNYDGGDRQVYGDFNGLLSDTGMTWLSVAIPVRAQFGGMLGEVQIHHAYNAPLTARELPAGTLGIAALTAFGVSLLFGWIASRAITRPIREMTDVAWRVTIGDYSVRFPRRRRFGKRTGKPDAAATRLRTGRGDELTHLADTMDSMVEKLDRTDQDRREFIANLSHDLRTPLTSIKGFIEGLIDGTIPENRRKEYLGIVKNEALRLETLVSAMADSAVVESGKVTYSEAEFDVNERIRLAIVGLQPQILERRLNVSMELYDHEDGRLPVVADCAAIDRVIYNLLSNAVKFSRIGGCVVARTRRQSRKRLAEILVEDDGPGIPEDERPYVFDRFYKGDPSRGSSGTGLGLHICRTILAAHGQGIEVGSSPLGGAAFRFHLRLP